MKLERGKERRIYKEDGDTGERVKELVCEMVREMVVFHVEREGKERGGERREREEKEESEEEKKEREEREKKKNSFVCLIFFPGLSMIDDMFDVLNLMLSQYGNVELFAIHSGIEKEDQVFFLGGIWFFF